MESYNSRQEFLRSNWAPLQYPGHLSTAAQGPGTGVERSRPLLSEAFLLFHRSLPLHPLLPLPSLDILLLGRLLLHHLLLHHLLLDLVRRG